MGRHVILLELQRMSKLHVNHKRPRFVFATSFFVFFLQTRITHTILQFTALHSPTMSASQGGSSPWPDTQSGSQSPPDMNTVLNPGVQSPIPSSPPRSLTPSDNDESQTSQQRDDDERQRILQGTYFPGGERDEELYLAFKSPSGYIGLMQAIIDRGES